MTAGIGRVSKVAEFEALNVESLRLGRDADKVACVVDPAGYFWEVLERHERNVAESLCKVTSNTNQLHACLHFPLISGCELRMVRFCT